MIQFKKMKKIIFLTVLICLSVISFGQRANKGTIIVNTISEGTIWQYFRGDKTWRILDTGEVPESFPNYYFTDARARSAFSLTTNGTSGVATYNPTTGVWNIPNYAPGSTYTDPMTTRGDILYRNSSNVTARLPLGADTYVLTSDGTDVRWAIPASNTYTLPLAANGTRGGVQIGYTSTDNNFALLLSSEKGYVALPNASTIDKGLAKFSSTSFNTSFGFVTLANAGISYNHLDNTTISGLTAISSGITDTDEIMISYGGMLRKTDVSVLGDYMETYLGSSSTPGGGTTNVQYNNEGTFGAEAAFSYSPVYNSLSVGSGGGDGSVYSGNFILTSDQRLKENIEALRETAWVDKINFRKFNIKLDVEKRQRYGVLAQEVELLNPNLVFTNEDGIKSVGYIDLLIAKAARQDEIINSLIKRIEKLEKIKK